MLQVDQVSARFFCQTRSGESRPWILVGCAKTGEGSPRRLQRARPEFQPRPKDSWVICGSALGLIEKAVEFAAGRIEGALLLFRAVVDQWAAVGPNRITNKFLGRDLS